MSVQVQPAKPKGQLNGLEALESGVSVRSAFRPAKRANNAARRKARADHEARGLRTAAPSARELFPVLRERLLKSRPVLEPARTVVFEHVLPGGGSWRQKHVIPPVHGDPTFRNVIDEKGRHV